MGMRYCGQKTLPGYIAHPCAGGVMGTEKFKPILGLEKEKTRCHPAAGPLHCDTENIQTASRSIYRPRMRNT